MAFPTLVYNASTGSDTAASGAGPATAVTGSSAAHTGGSASTTITLTNSPDLSGVATDGSAVLYLATTSGTRHLTKITAADNGAKTVTVEDSFTIASGSAVNYAIGGKRKTIKADTSLLDPVDYKTSWVATFEDGTYDIPSEVTMPAGGTSGYIKIAAATGAAPIFDVSYNGIGINPNDRNWFEGLSFTVSAGTKTSSSAFKQATSGTAIRCVIKGCTIDGFNDGIFSNYDWLEYTIIDTVIKNCLSSGVRATGDKLHLTMHGCRITNCVSGIILSYGYGDLVMRSCLIDNNSTDGVNFKDTGYLLDLSGCVFYANGDGLDVSGATASPQRWVVVDCIFAENTAYGIRGPANGDLLFALCNYNAYYTTGTAATLNITAGSADVTLTADPFTNKAGGDFSLNATAGGGAACKDVGFPQTIKGSSTDANLDIGAAQGTESGGGGTTGGPIIGSRIITAR